MIAPSSPNSLIMNELGLFQGSAVVFWDQVCTVWKDNTAPKGQGSVDENGVSRPFIARGEYDESGKRVGPWDLWNKAGWSSSGTFSKANQLKSFQAVRRSRRR